MSLGTKDLHQIVEICNQAFNNLKQPQSAPPDPLFQKKLGETRFIRPKMEPTVTLIAPVTFVSNGTLKI